MSLTNNINNWLSIILKFGLIIAVAVGIIWVGMSIAANIDEGKNAMPEFPDADKAGKTVLLKTTGEVLLTNRVDNPSPGIYILRGFFMLKDNEWEYYETDFQVDEYYFGKVVVRDRK